MLHNLTTKVHDKRRTIIVQSLAHIKKSIIMSICFVSTSSLIPEVFPFYFALKFGALHQKKMRKKDSLIEKTENEKKKDCKLPVENVSLSQYPRAKHDVIIGLVNFSHQRLQNIFAILIPSLLQTPDFTRRDKAIFLGECFKSNAISEG